jgi:hypothetical protein
MTWAEFKEKVEALGVKNEDILTLIDSAFTKDRIKVTFHPCDDGDQNSRRDIIITSY